MFKLNTTQEKHILRYLTNHPDLFKDAGASRMVFECTTDIADYLGLAFKDANSYVIKVALGLGGMEQMKTEVETFIQYEDTGAFAEIVAIGRYVEIMEAVEVWDFRDEADEGYTADDFYEAFNENGITERDAQDIEQTIEILHNIFGYTNDNGQLGKTNTGYWVAYDYGFIAGKGCDSQTSSISDYIWNDDKRELYMNGLIDLLSKEEDFMNEWEETFLEDC